MLGPDYIEHFTDAAQGAMDEYPLRLVCIYAALIGSIDFDGDSAYSQAARKAALAAKDAQKAMNEEGRRAAREAAKAAAEAVAKSAEADLATLGTAITPEHARLLARYTQKVVLNYDSDEAGKKAASRGIGILEKLDLKVRVLQVPGAKDPDEFIKKNGADAFRNLIDASAGQIEYRLRDVEAKNPPTTDEGRVDYLKSAASLLASLPGAVEREVYAARVAEKAGVSREAVLQEAERLRRRRIADAKKREARDAARPTQTAQPAQRSIRYDDPRSARAEEGLIRILYLDPGAAKGKTLPPPESFSSPVLARLYRELLRRVQTGETISMAVLAGQFTGDEMSHFTSVLGAPEDLSHADKAISDYIAVITGRTEDAEDDLRALAEKYRKTKSFGG